MPIEFQNRTGQGGFTLTKNANGGGLNIIQVSAYVPPPPSVTPSISVTPSASVTPSVTVSVTPSVTASATPSVSVTPSVTMSSTPAVSVTPSASVSNTPAISVTPSATVSATPAVSVTPSRTVSTTPAPTVTPSVTVSVTPAVSVTPSVTVSVTPVPTITPTTTPTRTPSVSATPTPTPTSTPAPTVTPSTSPVSSIVSSGLALNLDANSYSGTGTWNDLSGNGFTATIQGTLPFTSAGDLSYFTFNGGANYLSGNAGLNTAATNPVNGTLGISISTIFKMSDVTQPSILFSQLSGGGYAFECGTQPSNLWVRTLRAFAASNTSTDRRGTTQVLSNNVIYLMTWTWDQTTKVSTLYINESVAASSETTATVSSLNTTWAGGYGASFQIGAMTYYGQYGNGSMYKIMVYNKSLTSIEVTQNYNALKTRFGI